MSKNENIESSFVYETDNIEVARDIVNNHPEIGVIYHDTSSVPTPFLHLKIEGRTYTKYNPDYIAYLKREFPAMSEKEISEHMQNLYRSITNESKKTR